MLFPQLLDLLDLCGKIVGECVFQRLSYVSMETPSIPLPTLTLVELLEEYARRALKPVERDWREADTTNGRNAADPASLESTAIV